MRHQIAFRQYNPKNQRRYGLLWKSLNDARFRYTYSVKIVHSWSYSVQMRENKDQSNSEYGHFLRCAMNQFQMLCKMASGRDNVSETFKLQILSYINITRNQKAPRW